MINYNGTLKNDQEYLFNSKNRAFLYGDQIFETLRYHEGKLVFWEKHYFRMMGAACMLRMDIPQHLNMDFVSEEIIKTLEANKLLDNDARIRIVLFRRSGGYYTPTSKTMEFLIETDPLESNFISIGKGLCIDVFHDHKKPQEPLSSLKGGNSLPSVLSGIFAKENQLDEAIILNSDSNICETTSANIFIINKDFIYTPPLSSGCVDGIIRSILIEKANDLDIVIEEKSMKPFELIKADEVFLTNSIHGISYVKTYKKKEYSNSFSIELLNRLKQLI